MNINYSQLTSKILEFALRKPFSENVCYLKFFRDLGCNHYALVKFIFDEVSSNFNMFGFIMLYCTMFMADLLLLKDNCMGMSTFIVRSLSMIFI